MKKNIWILCISLLAMFSLGADGCDGERKAAVSDSGVSKTSVKVPTQANGLTTEQQNVRDRLVEDNKPGAIKHLYIISAYSGQVIIYSTVRGKITSSGKRLSPTSVVVGTSGEYRRPGFDFNGYVTAEVLQDDGTYGSSVEYLFFWDSKGAYHQHFVSGGQIVHVSDQPLSVKSIIINVETSSVGAGEAVEIPLNVKADKK
jgi:hypothetical protein